MSKKVKYPYELIDGMDDGQPGNLIVCMYKSLSIALRDCAKKNAPLMDKRFFVRRVGNGSKITA